MDLVQLWHAYESKYGSIPDEATQRLLDDVGAIGSALRGTISLARLHALAGPRR